MFVRGDNENSEWRAWWRRHRTRPQCREGNSTFPEPDRAQPRLATAKLRRNGEVNSNTCAMAGSKVATRSRIFSRPGNILPVTSQRTRDDETTMRDRRIPLVLVEHANAYSKADADSD